jgi:hypothetical protein
MRSQNENIDSFTQTCWPARTAKMTEAHAHRIERAALEKAATSEPGMQSGWRGRCTLYGQLHAFPILTKAVIASCMNAVTNKLDQRLQKLRLPRATHVCRRRVETEEQRGGGRGVTDTGRLLRRQLKTTPILTIMRTCDKILKRATESHQELMKREGWQRDQAAWEGS